MRRPFQRLRRRKEWLFFALLPRADARLAFVWWTVVLAHGVVPALFAIATGVLVDAVQRGSPQAVPLLAVGALFVVMQVMTPIQTAVSHNLGDRTAALLYDRQGDDWARVAYRDAARIDRDDCAPGAPRVPRPARGAAQSDVLLTLAAGARLSFYVGGTVGEVGFLRGAWMDSSHRLAWLEDYARSLTAAADLLAPSRIARAIRFDRVSFAYPGTDRNVLNDLTLELPAGSVVAIVGENGAGKSTLVKLLAKMYEPTGGRIFVDDVDLARISAADWRARLAGAFQDFFRFELQARHSVGVGDLPRLDDRAAVATAISRAGADDVVVRLRAGLETQLGPTCRAGSR